MEGICSSQQPILDSILILPVLHDHDEALDRIGSEIEVPVLVTVYQVEVGKRLILDHADLTRIGISGPDHPFI